VLYLSRAAGEWFYCKYVAVTPAFPGLMMSVVVSSPTREKVDAGTRRFETTFDDLRAHEGWSILTTSRVYREILGLMLIGLSIQASVSFGIVIWALSGTERH
jgi:hypothetical protein